VRSLAAVAVIMSVLSIAPAVAAAPEPQQIDLLVFSETAGFRHGSIPAGIAMFKRLAETETDPRYALTVTEAATSDGHFTAASLARYEAVVWLSTTLDVLSDAEQAAFEDYIRGGGGYVGIHAAADTEYAWPWYYDLVGAQFVSHPAIAQATIDVEDRTHAATSHLDATWVKTDEWYNYKQNPRSYVCDTDEEIPGVLDTGSIGRDVFIFHYGVDIPADQDPREKTCGVRVLMSVDESTYANNQDAMGDHPIAWCNEWDGGRAFYTGLGHTDASYTDPLFIQHVTGGVLAAAGLEGTDCEPPPPAE
jgi:cytochrome c